MPIEPFPLCDVDTGTVLLRQEADLLFAHFEFPLRYLPGLYRVEQDGQDCDDGRNVGIHQWCVARCWAALPPNPAASCACVSFFSPLLLVDVDVDAIAFAFVLPRGLARRAAATPPGQAP